jgi:hypothetical protein
MGAATPQLRFVSVDSDADRDDGDPLTARETVGRCPENGSTTARRLSTLRCASSTSDAPQTSGRVPA